MEESLEELVTERNVQLKHWIVYISASSTHFNVMLLLSLVVAVATLRLSLLLDAGSGTVQLTEGNVTT